MCSNGREPTIEMFERQRTLTNKISQPIDQLRIAKSVGMDNIGIESRLFDPETKQRRELWPFIKVVAPTDEKKKWRTREVESAYCLRCNKVFTYTPGTSKRVERHMRSNHPEDLDAE